MASSPLASGLPIAAVVGIVCSYGTLGGRLLDSLLLLGALIVQRRAWLSSGLAWVTRQISVLAIASAALAAAAAAVGFGLGHLRKPSPQASSSTQARWTGPGKPLLFPCVTTHTRLFPKMHSFVYSYLVVGIPVGWTGVCGGMVSTGSGPQLPQKKGWFHVDASDYLERGNGDLGLRGKLDAHLESQGINPAQYPHAYLVTAARFLGYHFNPASFWYLYDASKTLAAMIVEVNNTFGERRMYFLTPEPTSSKETSSQDAGGHPEAPSDAVLFKQKWPKDFHVSPFNSRKGSYELLANDPLAPNMRGTRPISVTIVLRSSHAHSKIVARLLSARGDGGSISSGDNSSSTRYVYDPTIMCRWRKARFLAAWWWVGLVTFPRIVKQAGLLFFQKRLHVWFRPEPLETSMGRLADATERQLEAVFRQYLRYLVESVTDAKTPLAVKYIPCGLPDDRPELFLSAAARDSSIAAAATTTDDITVKSGADVKEIEFRVLTPVFYTRFAHYAHDVEAFFCELRESGTLTVSPQPALFTQLVLAKPAPPPPLQVTSPVDFVCFKAIQKLRRRPARIERPMTWPANHYSAAASTAPTSATTTSGDLRRFRPSAMDGFVLAHADEHHDLRRSYRTAVLALFIADRTAFGSVPLLRAQWLVLRAAIAWFVARGLLGVLERGR